MHHRLFFADDFVIRRISDKTNGDEINLTSKIVFSETAGSLSSG